MAQEPLRVEEVGGKPPADIEFGSRRPLVRLHVPSAPHRSGDEPCFSGFSEQPEDLDRPHPLADYQQLRPHAHGLVRVLNDRGEARGVWNPELSPEVLVRGLEWMARVRAFDTRLMTMQRQGRLSFYLSCLGEEAVAVAATMALEKDDLLFPSYRQPGLFLARGMTPVQMMCQCIGNQRDSCRGRQMPIHYSWRKGRVVSISSPVGTQFPQAVGAAMAMAIRGESDVAAAWMGEGTTAQGDFHYALNFASVYEPPVVLNVVNNQWAISTPSNIASGGKSFAARADPFALPGLRVDGNDFLAVYAATAWAAQRARAGGGSTLIELVTYRAAAHSSSDDPS
ncbi:MAG: thiamine pyrophosphate-dependent dehydrogenase E1 component subunit alpha, partial [Pirellulales bacterium]